MYFPVYAINSKENLKLQQLNYLISKEYNVLYFNWDLAKIIAYNVYFLCACESLDVKGEQTTA